MILDIIPEDILERVADFLDRSDLLCLLRVNRPLQRLFQRRIYRNLDCSEMPPDLTQWISQKLELNGGLASAVRAIRVVPRCASFKTRSLSPLGVDSATSRLLKACPNVKQLELTPPAPEVSGAALESCTGHMRLDRLGLFNSRPFSTNSYVFGNQYIGAITGPINLDPYMLLLRQQSTLTQLLIDPEIRDPEDSDFQSGDLPALHSLSACPGIIQLLKAGRSIRNVNLAFRRRDTIERSRDLQLLSGYSADAPSQEPTRRLRIDMPNMGDGRMNWVLERIISGASKLNRVELHCTALTLDKLARVTAQLRSLSELRVVFFGTGRIVDLLQGGTPETLNTFRNIKANSPNLKMFLDTAVVLAVDGQLPSELYPGRDGDGVLGMFDGILDDSQPLEVGESMFGHDFWSSDIE